MWPQSGRHVLAQFDADTVHVYQAFRPAIARFAVEHQKFGGEFSFNRMSWIKPNFLWMMYRSGWATKEGQEHVLAIRLNRKFFDELLRTAVPSTYQPQQFANPQDWQSAVAASVVRLQWDPDHDPLGRPLARRAIQLGLRGEALRRYGHELVSVEDMTSFVAEQRLLLHEGFAGLQVPEERIYYPNDPQAAAAAGIDELKAGWEGASSETIRDFVLAEMPQAGAVGDWETQAEIFDMACAIADPAVRGETIGKLLLMPGHEHHQEAARLIQDEQLAHSLPYIRQMLESRFASLENSSSEPAAIAKWFSHALASIGTPDAIQMIREFAGSAHPDIAKEMAYRLKRLSHRI